MNASMFIAFQKWDTTIFRLRQFGRRKLRGLQRGYIKSLFKKHHLAIFNPALLRWQAISENIAHAGKYINNNNGSWRYGSAMGLLSK